MSPTRSIAVLGGGITGLTAAYRLHQLGHRVRLFEQSGRLGGAIRTEICDGWLVEGGPNSFQETPGTAADLLRELGLADQRVTPAAAANNRYIARGNRLVPVPHSPGEFLGGSFLSAGAKLRVLGEWFTRIPSTDTDVSLADFTRGHFGREVLERAVQPFVSGVYAGDPEKLSARYAFPKIWATAQSHGSLLRGQLASAKARRSRGETATAQIISLRRGLQTLPHALASRMPEEALSLHARIERLVPGNRWKLAWHDGEYARTESFDAIVSALPALALSRLIVGTGGERPLAALETLPHPPVASLFLGFKRAQVAHPLDGFGALIPAREKRSLLGVIFSSSLFPERAPEGHVALTVMLGGTLQPHIASDSAGELLAAARRDLTELLGVKGDPVFVRHTFWPRAIPQYNLGYERFLAAMTACEEAHPGFFIGGQVRDGISLPNCLAAGEKLAARAAA